MSDLAQRIHQIETSSTDKPTSYSALTEDLLQKKAIQDLKNLIDHGKYYIA